MYSVQIPYIEALAEARAAARMPRPVKVPSPFMTLPRFVTKEWELREALVAKRR